MRLAGKTAVVTGAGSGFGAGIARKFAAEGAQVFVVDINGDAAKEIAAEIGGTALTCDVSDAQSVSNMAQIVLSSGPLDILVNNAGVTHLPNQLEDVTEDDFDRVYRVNMKSVFLLAKAFVPHFKSRKAGAILNVASTAGVSPRPRLNWYNASKGWMITATRTMAVELAPNGIRVNAINPVAGDTPLLKTFMGEDTPEMRAKFLATIPIGRFSTPEDMGNAACFLCSDEASMITGVAWRWTVAAASKRNLITDVAGLRVGNAQDEHIKTGTTVLVGDKPFTASVHVMGGAPGTKETDLLAPDKTVQQVDALVLSGGSAFGLDACSGVMDGLRAMGRGFAIGEIRIPIVPGAIVFDLINGGHKDWDENPYRSLGRKALENATQDFALGTAGAGTGAMAAMQKGGLGSVSLTLEDGTTVGALVVVNALGSVTTPGDRHFWAAPFEVDGEFGGAGPDTRSGLITPEPSRKEQAMMLQATQGANTTIAIVATDAPLTKVQCHRLAVTAHDGMARAIVPSHTPLDGDLVFGVSTGEGEPVDQTKFREIAAAAAVCLSRAIARGVYEATPADDDIIPTYKEMNSLS